LGSRLEEAIRLVRAGDAAAARALLVDELKQNPDDDQAWVWMSAAVDSADLRRECLEKALQVNPQNSAARRGLAALERAGQGAAAAPSAGRRAADAVQRPTIVRRGRCPPRLLTPDSSIWLPQGSLIHLFGGGLAVYARPGEWTLGLTTGPVEGLRLNGEPVAGERHLRDGDFIDRGRARFLFQADPAGDRAARLAQERSSARLPRRVKPDPQLQVDEETVSIDGGRTLAAWETIRYLQIRMTIGVPRTALWLEMQAGSGAPTKSAALTPAQLNNFFRRVEHFAPADLCIRNPWDYHPRAGGWHSRMVEADAYVWAARKLLKAVDSGAVDLPLDRRFVLGAPPRGQGLGPGVVMLLLGAAAIATPVWLLAPMLQNAPMAFLGGDPVRAVTTGCLAGGVVLLGLVSLILGAGQIARSLLSPAGG